MDPVAGDCRVGFVSIFGLFGGSFVWCVGARPKAVEAFGQHRLRVAGRNQAVANRVQCGDARYLARGLTGAKVDAKQFNNLLKG